MKILVEDADVYALKALAQGVASPGQQKRVLSFILNASGVREMPQVSDNPYVDAFNQGRHFVGWQVARLVELTGLTDQPPESPTD